MGRPSKKEQRTKEIVDAFYQCVARFGLEGSTLEHIAEEAGLQRSLVRHFVGNRESLVTLLVDQVLAKSDEQWLAFLDLLPQENAVPALVLGMFSEQHSDAEYILVIESLIFSANRDEKLRLRMQRWFAKFTDDISVILKQQYPQACEAKIAAVSFGLLSLYFNLDSLSPLAMNHIYRQPAQAAAQLLVGTLD